jgi:hypothetical protein
MRIETVIGAIVFVLLGSVLVARSEDLTKGPPNLTALQGLRLKDSGISETAEIERALASTWPLNTERAGTYGIDLSHYETQPCKIDLQKLTTYGLRFAYLETTRGIKAYTSVSKVWALLEPMHRAKTLFRGAYHFLLPNAILTDEKGNSLHLNPTDPSAQTDAFLKSIGATDGKSVAELAPVLDIEPTGTPVDPNSDDWNKCPVTPVNRRSTTTSGNTTTYYCDMWYKVTDPKDIVTLAMNWIGVVKKATGKDVTVYSSPGAWDQVVGGSPTRKSLLNGRAIWLAHYTSGPPGPDEPTGQYWSPSDWNAALKMPTLLDGTPYPSGGYNVPNFWQFSKTGTFAGTATGIASSGPFSCDSNSDNPLGKLDFSFVPLNETQFESVFKAP